MSEEHKRSPLTPRPTGKPLPISAEIEVPFEMYKQYCSQCVNREKTLTPHSEYVKQLTKFMNEREPIKITCSAINRCLEIQRRDDVKVRKTR